MRVEKLLFSPNESVRAMKEIGEERYDKMHFEVMDKEAELIDVIGTSEFKLSMHELLTTPNVIEAYNRLLDTLIEESK